jgi:hypothetical protein
MTTKLAAGILALGLAAGTAWAQNPNIIQSTHDTMKALQNKDQVASDDALGNTAKAGAQPAAAQLGATPRSSGMAAQTTVRHSAKFKVVTQKKTVKGKTNVTVNNGASSEPVSSITQKSIVATGQRDPFISPVVNQTMTGSGCSVGKKCLAIDQIALKGVVRSENGMIAVVVNALDKAYFLRENDPVFNGYVVKITGDSVIFKETVQDNLGKPFTREVTKKITTPAV